MEPSGVHPEFKRSLISSNQKKLKFTSQPVAGGSDMILAMGAHGFLLTNETEKSAVQGNNVKLIETSRGKARDH